MRVAVVSSARTPFTKMGSVMRKSTAVDLGVGPVNTLVDKFKLGDDPSGLLVFGTVIQHSDVSNISREVALESKLHPQTRAFSSVMACATSLSTIAEASSWITRGSVPWAIAGGSESSSNFPVSYPHSFGKFLGDLQVAKTTTHKLKAVLSLRPKDFAPKVPPVAERLTGLTMGQHCELMVKEWKLPREPQDEWAVMSHKRAAAKQEWHSKFLCAPPKYNGRLADNLIRGDTTLEKAAKLKPVFAKDGTITAANASPMTDGGAAVLLASEEFARKQGWPILAYLDDMETAAVDINKEGLLMAPPYAILRLLKRQGKKLSDFDLLEIHEAFAAQVLCNLKALQNNDWCMQRVGIHATTVPGNDRINVNGGSIPLGHPFGATGARLVGQLAQEFQDGSAKSGLISVCAAGGLGFVMTLVKA